MKLSFTFQTLIMAALAPVLAAVTAFWGVYVYRSVHDAILAGFDRKLLTLSSGAAAFVDGDAHALYQRRRNVVAFAPRPGGGFLGVDTTVGELVAVDSATGAARPVAKLPGGAPRALAALQGNARLFALAADGAGVAELEGATGTIARTVALSGTLEGVFGTTDKLLGWRERELFRVDPVSGALMPTGILLPEPARSLAFHAATNEWVALTTDRASLVVLDAQGGPARKLALHALAVPPETATAEEKAAPERLPPPPLHTLASAGDKLYGAGASLVTIDVKTGLVSRGDFSPGFFDVEHPYYRRNRAAFVALQKEAGLSYLYTQVYLGEKKIYYVLDGTVGKSYSPPGSADVLPATSVEAAEWVQLERAPLHRLSVRNGSEQYLGHSWMSPIQNWSAWGLLKSCFTPIYDSAANSVGMAGADVDITTIRHRTRWALFAVVFVGLLTLIGAGFISFAVARALTQPLRKIKNSALWIAAGYYGTKLDAPGTREMAQLAHMLNALSAHATDEETRAGQYRRDLGSRRRDAVLEAALRAQADSPAVIETTPFVLSPPGGIAGAGPRAVLWLSAPAGDALNAVCLRARAGCLARTLLTAHPGMPPAAIVAAMCEAMPQLAACAVWSADTRQLHVFSRTPLHLPATSASASPIRIGDGTTEVAVPGGQRWRWAETGAPA